MLGINSTFGFGSLYSAQTRRRNNTLQTLDTASARETNEAEIFAAENELHSSEDGGVFTFKPDITDSDSESGMKSAKLSESDYRSLTEYIKSHRKQLETNPNAEVDPDGKIYAAAYVEGLVTQYKEAEMAIREYYGDAHRENLTFDVPSNHISEKYLWENSNYFKKDMSEAERLMAFHQERALLFGGSLALNDPYALAAKGGVPKFDDVERFAKQYAQSKIDALIQAKKTEQV